MMIHFYKVVSFYVIRVPPYVDFMAVVSDMMALSSDMYCRYFDMIASGDIAFIVSNIVAPFGNIIRSYCMYCGMMALDGFFG